MYGKIFDSMYEGTLYGHWQAIVTLQQMLVLCNSEGVVDMTPQAIAARTSIPLEIIAKGIEVLSASDPYTRTPGEDGVRISLLESHRPWGWYIVNFKKYQKLKSREEKLDADRKRIADKRNANKINGVANCHIESQPVVNVAHAATAKPEAKEKSKPLSGKPDDLPGFISFWEVWPKTDRKQGRKKCLEIWIKRGLEVHAGEILVHVEHMTKSESWRTGFDPMPTTYLNGYRWDGAETGAVGTLGQCSWNLNDTREPGTGRCPEYATVEKGSGVYCKPHATRINQ